MNPEVGGYYRSSSPWKSLNNKLTPIFDQLRAQNICEKFQLKEQEKEAGSTFGVPDRYTVTTMKQTIQQKQRTPFQKGHYGQLRNRQRKKKIDQLMLGEPRQNDKIMLVSSKSKIKKHLVDTIDYKGMQSSLYQKSSRVTRYEHFYQTLVNKDKWHNRTNRSLELAKSKNQQNNSQLYSTLNDVRRPFRIKSRRIQPTYRMELVSHRYTSLGGY